tara:strand:+ start:254 stop:427 length:174 start_codon:yes stop_codon:yes gene_type:complete
MYTATLTIDNYYRNITSYEIWKLDPDYFIFYWAQHNQEVVIKKEYVISIMKNKIKTK